LIDFLTREGERLRSMWHTDGLGHCVALSSRGFEATEIPLTKMDHINRSAFRQLQLGVVPTQIAIPIDARELARFLETPPPGDPLTTLCRFFEQREHRLAMTEMLAKCFEAAATLFVITGYETPTARNALGPLTRFLVTVRRYLATRRASARGDALYRP
jgi:hypothetical protein